MSKWSSTSLFTVMSKKKVAVIGAGVSGLAAVKSCLEEGLQPTCFEQHGDIGGLWYRTDDFRPGQGPCLYDSLITNSSRDMMCFSDFPFPRDVPPYITCSHVHNYLRTYADNFGLQDYIHLNTQVLKVSKARDYDVTGRWEVETLDDHGIPHGEVYDAVMVCSGFFKVPHYPQIEGMDVFEGFKEHSFTFKTGRIYENKRVLVIGNANSAGDVAADVSNFSAQVYLSVGRGCWILPRLADKGIPRDFTHRRALFKIPDFVVNKIIMKDSNSRLNHETLGIRPDTPPLNSAIMVNDEIQMKIMSGKVKVMGNVTRLCDHKAWIDDGTVIEELDGIIFATGYDRNVDFLDSSVGGGNEKLELFKMAFPVHLRHQTLAMIGCLSTVGAHAPVFELQSRLAARVFSGRHQLPAKEIMIVDVEKWNNFVKKRSGYYKYKFPNLPLRDDIAAELGVKPNILDLFCSKPSLAFRCLFGPAFPAQYRLRGPGAWEGAERACIEAYENTTLSTRHRHPVPMKHYSDMPNILRLLCAVFLCIILMYLSTQ